MSRVLLRALSLALVLAAPIPAAAGPEGPPFYDRGRNLEQQREAARAVADGLRRGGVEAVVEAFLEPSAIVRDLAMSTLVQRNDPQLLRGLERQLGHREEFVSAQVAELFARTRYAAGREALERAGLRSRSEETVLESIWALEALGDPQAGAALERTFKRRHPASEFRVQGDALLALSRVDPERARGLTDEALADRRPPIVMAGLIALGRLDPAAGARAAVDVIGARPLPRGVASWEGRLLFAALDTLAGWTQRSADRELAVAALVALIERLGRSDGLPRYRTAVALADLTGQELGDDPGDWGSWWTPRRDSFVFEDKAPAGDARDRRHRPGEPGAEGGDRRPVTGRVGTRVRFHGIPIHSNRILFAQDVSGGMDLPLDPDDGGSPSRLAFSVEELVRVLGSLADEVLVNVAFFATTYNATAERLRPIGRVRRQLLQFVDEASVIAPLASGMSRSNLYDTLIFALSDPEIDTVFFLSEGRTNEGRYQEDERLLRHLARFNTYSRVEVHTLQITPPGSQARFLQRLSGVTGGAYYDLEFLKRARGR